ncbi:hypothetical protein AC579_9803 [Pseudocercospora musae]|uniref:Uncharacterized protein n=1 Tax=Pseudocercospora musae TaxID=113226 RepID=A0A139IV60_9PEZI|nr:hypothetical protein AC579_9803 [Pseudocercospora musae]
MGAFSDSDTVVTANTSFSDTTYTSLAAGRLFAIPELLERILTHFARSEESVVPSMHPLADRCSFAELCTVTATSVQ